MTETNEKQQEKKEIIPAEVPRDSHKVVKYLANLKDKDIRDIYAEVVPLGIDAFTKKYSITIPPLN